MVVAVVAVVLKWKKCEVWGGTWLCWSWKREWVLEVPPGGGLSRSRWVWVWVWWMWWMWWFAVVVVVAAAEIAAAAAAAAAAASFLLLVFRHLLDRN